MKILSLLLSLGFLLHLTGAIIAGPKKPSDDDFYKSPGNIADYKEGEIMKWRNTPQKVRSVIFPINIQGAWQFMVRSTNTQGQPVGIVGTLLQPFNADPKKVLAYNYFMDSVDINCSPSYSILFGADDRTITTQLESVYMNAALKKGWYVVVTDYEGPNAAFAAGKLSGMATLNTIRAALSSGKTTGISPDAKVAIWGYSGGSIPLAWAGELQPSYAPELTKNLVGIAVGGLVTNITLVVEKIDGTTYAGFVGAGMLGLASEYPEVQSQMFGRMVPLKVDQVKRLYSLCVIGTLVNFVGFNFFKGPSPVFKEGKGILEVPEVKQMMDENILALNLSSPMPNVPFFVYHGKADQIIPFENSQRLYDSWCSRGIRSMEFAVSQSSGHINEWIEGGGAALEWLSKRLNGQDPVSGCSRVVRQSNLDYPGAQQAFSSFSRTAIAAVFQTQLGPLVQRTSSNSFSIKIVYDIFVSLIKALRVFSFKRGLTGEENIGQPLL